MSDKRLAQLKYELAADATAQAEKLTGWLKSAASGDANTPHAAKFLARALRDVVAILEEEAQILGARPNAKYRDWLKVIPTPAAAYTALHCVISLCATPGSRTSAQTLCGHIGRLWELEYRITCARKVNPPFMRRVDMQVSASFSKDEVYLRKKYSAAAKMVLAGHLEGLSNLEIIQYGKFGADACLKAGIITQCRGLDSKGTKVWYELHPEIMEYLTSYDFRDTLGITSRSDSRMICPPDPFNGVMDGGYLTELRKAQLPLLRLNKIRRALRAQYNEEFSSENMPAVFSAANYLQSQSFSLHAPTRDAIIRCWESGGGAMGVPPVQRPPKPPSPFAKDWSPAHATPEEKVAFNIYKAQCKDYYQGLQAWSSNCMEVGAFIKSARGDDTPFWCPVYYDTRGRLYYRGTPNPQGSDMARATIHFTHKKPLGPRGLYWMKVQIANSFGFDKERLDLRAAWTDENWPRIRAALDFPEDNREVWGTDAPWVMFSTAWEMREALDSGNPDTYETGLPIHMDATCSGLQHFSAMLRDEVGAAYVNLSDTGSGPKQDIYSRVAGVAMASLDSVAEEYEPEVIDFIRKVGISRKMAKKPVMTYCYGATVRGTKDYLEMLLHKEILPSMGIQKPDNTTILKAASLMAVLLFKGIEGTTPAAAEAMRWLQKASRVRSGSGPMTWTTPDGFRVYHDYPAKEEYRLNISALNLKKMNVLKVLDTCNKKKMASAISPNFVHALDATHMRMCSNRMQEAGLGMMAIHDSFGTHPGDVDTLHAIIREELVKLYSHNVLSSFAAEVDVGEAPPAAGAFNLMEMLQSEFLFS